MTLSRTLIIFALLFTPLIVFSQERGIPVYSDYLTDNLYLLHPSMAGAAQQSKVRLTGRTQWFDVNNAPHLETISANGRIGDRVGVGGIIYNDRNGRFSQQGFFGTFAYHILMSRDELDLNQLSFGLNVGLVQEGLDESDLIGPGQPADPIISGNKQSDFTFNVDLGMSYYFMEFFAHVSAKNLIPQKRDIFSEEFETDNQRSYLLSVGYTIVPQYSNWNFEPSIMVQHKEVTNETLGDINGKAYYNFDWGQLWGGLSYRRTLSGAEYNAGDFTSNSVSTQKLQYLTPFLGINYRGFVFAYTYSYQPNDIVMDNSGYHQITLGFNFGKNRVTYRCGCPTINQ
ncbi:MAG TPA: type IX secretion system membrane protein PorP/SprF [Flavobacteriaceae bacterium]|nr:type IX secretion system membrane protein PorP/SprF [Flavobacteriaceae bacterium]